MNLNELYPNITSKIEDKDLDELRYLIVVDRNEYDPEIDDEFDVFEPDDYNYLAYLTERLQEAMGEELLESLASLIEADENFDDYLRSELDLYGLQSKLEDEESVAKAILNIIEKEMAKWENSFWFYF